MPAAWVAAGTAIVGAVSSASAASSAANSQADSANQANATQLQMYNQTRADNAPFLANGTAASNKLAGLLGISGPAGVASKQALAAEIMQKFPTWSAGGGDVVDSFLATAPRILSDPALQQEWGYGPESLATLQSLLPRAQQAAAQATTDNSTDPSYGSLLKKFDQTDLNKDVPYQLGYNYAQDQASTGVNRLAAANGSLNSGATLKALQDRGVQVANQYAGDAFNRYQTQNTDIYNKLSGASGAGQAASNTVSSAGTSTGAGIANTTTSMGNARGASAIAQGNAFTSGAGSISNYYQQQNMLNRNNGYSVGSNNYNGYVNNANSNGFGNAFTQNGNYG